MGTIIYLLLLLVATLGLVVFLETRKHETISHVVTTTCRPGMTTLRMADEKGVVRAVLVLRQINWSFDGPTTAEFTDLTYYARSWSVQIPEQRQP